MELLTLADIVRDLTRFDDEASIWVPAGKPTSSTEAVIRPPEADPLPRPWQYLLEIYLAQEAIEVWRAWRPGREPTLEDMVAAVVHYGMFDAWLPVEES